MCPEAQIQKQCLAWPEKAAARVVADKTRIREQDAMQQWELSAAWHTFFSEPPPFPMDAAIKLLELLELMESLIT